MTDSRQNVAAAFDVRAATYSTSQWHRAYAEGLVAGSAIRGGDRVLDVGVGTGFAAIAAAARVGPAGQVVGVDLSPGMLRQARVAVDAAQLRNVELIQGDACDLHEWPAASFDGIICSAALLYMPVQRALAEWHRLLRPGGIVGFSTMRAGFPQAARLFRECAAELGLQLVDPSAALGSEPAAAAALRHAGFAEISVVADRVLFADADFRPAWESNVRWPAYEEVRNLAATRLEALRSRFEHALDELRRRDPSFAMAEVLYAYGSKPADV